jgi:hypothetical protein
VANGLSRSALRQQIEHHLTSGRCAYCRARASPERPLTREHLVPRSRGGGRHDHRIIVPACARCNYRRGCQDLILFLLARPYRLSALLDHFSLLPPDLLRQIDPRVFAELYATLWVLEDCAREGSDGRVRIERICGSRTVHRRRYAARRIVGSAAERLMRARMRSRSPLGHSCPVPGSEADRSALGIGLAEPLAVARARLLTLLSLAWWTPADEVEQQLRSARERTQAGADDEEANRETRPRRRTRRTLRTDRRRGRGVRPRSGYGRRAA